MTGEARSAQDDPIEVRTEPIEYMVTAVSDRVSEAFGDGFTIRVVRRSEDRWAVLRWSRCLGADGEWDYESIPSERTDEWKATHRFDLDTALRLAQEAAPKVTVNGWTVAAAIREVCGDA